MVTGHGAHSDASNSNCRIVDGWHDQRVVSLTTSPIARLSFEMRNGKNDDFIVACKIDDRKGEFFGKDAPGSILVRGSSERHRACQFYSSQDRQSKSFSQAGLDGFVVAHRIQKLETRSIMKTRFLHCVSCRACANTSAAFTSTASPRS